MDISSIIAVLIVFAGLVVGTRYRGRDNDILRKQVKELKLQLEYHQELGRDAVEEFKKAEVRAEGNDALRIRLVRAKFEEEFKLW